MENEDRVSFWDEESIRLDGFLYLILKRQPKEALDPDDLIDRTSFMALLKRNGEGFYLFTEEYRLNCNIEGGLIKISYADDDISFDERNRMMRYGIPVMMDEVIVVVDHYTYTSEKVWDSFVDSHKGVVAQIENEAFEYTEDFREMLKVKSQELGEIHEENESYTPHRKLEKLLKTAENYAHLECDLAEKEAQKNGTISYSRIEAMDYDRNDRTAYSFIVDTLKENVFSSGTQVEIEVENEEGGLDAVRAEVLQAVKAENPDEESHIDLLFHRQEAMDRFPSFGWIRKSFSTVMRDVQLRSIEHIRNHEAPAKYMDDVFGERKPKGFDQKDLTALEADLAKEKFPPRPSQLEAIKNGINTKDVYLVLGPPGTGKTTVILKWVKYFVEQEHLRVLVSSQNNKAVDNVLERLAQEKDIDIIRIGSEAKVQANVAPFLFEHKLERTRRQIAERTESAVGVADKIDKAWQEIRKLYQPIPELLQEVEKAKTGLEKHLALLSEMRDRILSLHESYRAVYLDNRQQEDALRARYEKIMGYPTDGWKGLWGKFMRWYAKGEMRKLVERYDQSRERERQAVSMYNDIRQKYEDFYHKTLHEAYAPLQGCLSRYHEAYEVFSAGIQQAKRLDYPAWNFVLATAPPESSGDVLLYAESLEQDIHRLEGFIDHLKGWKEKNLDKQCYAVQQMILESADLVGATCIGVSSQKRYADLKYDVTIIDEAGQIQIHNALVPMSLSNKLIMLGDDRQIPPSASDELKQLCRENGVDTDLLKRSIFEVMYQEIVPDTNKTLLDTQFRMPPEIAEIISKWFYDHKYQSPQDFPFKENVKSRIPALSSARMVVIDTSEEKERMERKDPITDSTYNEFEADIIAELMKLLLAQESFQLGDVGIISAYKCQVGMIRGKLESFMDKNGVRDIVATLDSFQGQERDIIIYSFTRSSTTPPDRRRIGFLNELRRLNVAITRCREMLVLIGDMKFLSECNHEDVAEEDNENIQEASERNFAKFIREMLEGIKNGNEGFRPGEVVNYREFCRRIGK